MKILSKSTFLAVAAFIILPLTTFAAGNSVVNIGTSLNWVGYVATGTDFTSVTGTWVVPSVAPSANGAMQADATWIGIGGIGTTDLIQAGTQAIAEPSGSISYEAWYETLPQTTQAVPLSVAAGDSITVAVTETAQNVWEFSFRNDMTGQAYSMSLSYTSSLSSAEWVEEMPMSNNAFLPLDNFGTISFTGGSAVENGSTFTIAGANAQPLTMISGTGQPLATLSPLGADGASFIVTRSAASSASVTTAPGVGRGIQGFVPRGHGVAMMFSPSPRSALQPAQLAAYGKLLAQMLAQLQALQTQMRTGSVRR